MDLKNKCLGTTTSYSKQKTDKSEIGVAVKQDAKLGSFTWPKPKPKGLTFCQACKKCKQQNEAWKVEDDKVDGISSAHH